MADQMVFNIGNAIMASRSNTGNAPFQKMQQGKTKKDRKKKHKKLPQAAMQAAMQAAKKDKKKMQLLKLQKKLEDKKASKACVDSISRVASLQAFVKVLTSGTKDILYKGVDPLQIFRESQKSSTNAISPFDVVEISGSASVVMDSQERGESKRETMSLESKTSGNNNSSSLNTCRKSHPLKMLGTSRDAGWSCSGMTLFPGGCKKGCTGFYQTKGWKRWRCELCDFDLCEDCLKEDRPPPGHLTTVLKLAAKHSLPLFMHILDVLEHAKANSAKHVELVERWSLNSLRKESKLVWESTWTVLHELVDASDADVSMKMEERGVALKKLIALYQMEDRRTSAGNLKILCQRKAVRDNPPTAQYAFGWKEVEGLNDRISTEGVTNLMRNRRTQRSNRRGTVKYGRKASPYRQVGSSMIASRASNARHVTLAHMFKDFVLRVRRNFTYSLSILFDIIVSFYQEPLTDL